MTPAVAANPFMISGHALDAITPTTSVVKTIPCILRMNPVMSFNDFVDSLIFFVTAARPIARPDNATKIPIDTAVAVNTSLRPTVFISNARPPTLNTTRPTLLTNELRTSVDFIAASNFFISLLEILPALSTASDIPSIICLSPDVNPKAFATFIDTATLEKLVFSNTNINLEIAFSESIDLSMFSILLNESTAFLMVSNVFIKESKSFSFILENALNINGKDFNAAIVSAEITISPILPCSALGFTASPVSTVPVLRDCVIFSLTFSLDCVPFVWLISTIFLRFPFIDVSNAITFLSPIE